MKKNIISVVVIFILWSLLDMVIHQVILGDAYGKTAELWRPMGEMKTGLMHFVGLICAAVFVKIYTQFFAKKNMMTGLQYGLLYGLGWGVSFGYGSYSVMPIPYYMALTWFLGTLIEIGLAGLLLGLIVKD